MPSRKSKPETQLQARIVAALEELGFLVIRIHCGRARVKGGYMHFAPPGTPDLLVIGRSAHGIPNWLETKTPKGRASSAQRLVHYHLRHHFGQVVHIVHSVEEAVEACT